MQYALINIVFVLNDANANLRVILLDLAYKDLVCFIIRQARVDKLAQVFVAVRRYNKVTMISLLASTFFNNIVALDRPATFITMAASIAESVM